MKTELEKCMAGEWCDCHDPIFIAGKARASEWCAKYNSVPYSKRKERRKMLEELFGAIGENVSVGDNFTCGFGTNIYIGSNVSINRKNKNKGKIEIEYYSTEDLERIVDLLSK